jgi:hypothetical protein
MRAECDRKLGKWTLSTHALPVYALSLSLLECSPLILQHKTIKQKPYCQAMIFLLTNWEILNNFSFQVYI